MVPSRYETASFGAPIAAAFRRIVSVALPAFTTRTANVTDLRFFTPFPTVCTALGGAYADAPTWVGDVVTRAITSGRKPTRNTCFSR